MSLAAKYFVRPTGRHIFDPSNVGLVWVLRPLGLLPMAVSFLATFGVLVAVFAVAGNSFWALWSPEPVGGLFYWTTIVLSPETLIFVLFMMSDPVTAPKSTPGRIIYGVATALLAAGLLSFQPTEFGVKPAILSSLTVTCALVPFLEGAVRRVRGDGAASGTAGAPHPTMTRLAQTGRRPAVTATANHRPGRPGRHRPTRRQRADQGRTRFRADVDR